MLHIKPQRRSRNRNYQALCQQLTNDPRPARAQRKPQTHLAPTRRCARKLQVRYSSRSRRRFKKGMFISPLLNRCLIENSGDCVYR